MKINRMNLLLVAAMLAYLDTNQGFTHIASLKGTHRSLSTNCIALRNVAGGTENVLSGDNVLPSLFAVNDRNNMGNRRIRLRSVIQKIHSIFRSGYNSNIVRNAICSTINRSDNDVSCSGEVNNINTVISHSKESNNADKDSKGDRISYICNSISSMRNKVTVEKIRLLPAFVMVNLLSVLKFVRPCAASGTSIYGCVLRTCLIELVATQALI